MVNWNEKLTRQTEPYHFQRKRNAIHSSYSRPAQPNISQPNQITRVWGSTTQEYWGNVLNDYLKRRKAAGSVTNLALGRL